MKLLPACPTSVLKFNAPPPSAAGVWSIVVVQQYIHLALHAIKFRTSQQNCQNIKWEKLISVLFEFNSRITRTQLNALWSPLHTESIKLVPQFTALHSSKLILQERSQLREFPSIHKKNLVYFCFSHTLTPSAWERVNLREHFTLPCTTLKHFSI